MRVTSFALVFLVGLAVGSIAADAKWETLRNCELLTNESNDGDSFHVRAGGQERIFRLYFVDSPESEFGGYVTERIKQQAQEFGISEEATVEIGKKAAAFTRAVLSRPFTVLTRGQNALGSSKLKREYAFVTTADGKDLGELLLDQGLARSHGEAVSLPGKDEKYLWRKYDSAQAKAKTAKLGAWGEGAAAPTMALPQPSER